MDSRDRLRRYLEQRRELGESEYVLDSLSVEAVMRLVDAKPGATKRGAKPALQSEGIGRGSAVSSDESLSAPPSEGPAMPMTPPALPPTRFDEATSTDWRAALGGLGPSTQRSNRNPAESPEAARLGVVPGASGGVGPESAGADAGGANAVPSQPTPLAPWLAAFGLPDGLEVGAASSKGSDPEISGLPSLDAIARHVAACQRCTLCHSAKNPVPGEGNPNASLLCVGEAPGADEDAQGRPFVGEAGQLLTKILGAIQLTRESVWICNVLKHRPPGNRDPRPEEVLFCQPYLQRQIELVRPRVILALGRFAAQTLLQTTASVGALRGRIHRYDGIPVIVTYHPSALLRNESWKRPTWEDVKLARRILDAALAGESH